MELGIKKPLVVKEEEIRAHESAGDDEGEASKFKIEIPIHDGESSSPSLSRKNSQVLSSIITGEKSSMETSPRPSSSSAKESSTEDQLEYTKAEMGEVREENERLKMILGRIANDYRSLEMQYYEVAQQEQAKKLAKPSPIPIDVEEHELVSLSLGTSASGHKKEEIKVNTGKIKESTDHGIEEGLTLGLDCKFEGSGSGNSEQPVVKMSPENSFEETKEEEASEQWPPNKMLKNIRAAAAADDDISQQTHVKKARVSVRARCDSPTMNDGCQWRKYGQKIAKGNPCPRAYYRCTVAPACPVRKQVQRCAEDMSILITTYEGNHNHPLPISATAMASTTSAAASMLMSGSYASRPAIGSPSSSSTSAINMASGGTNAGLHGLNFNLPDSSRPRQFYLPSPSISTSPAYPTITLDLTAPPSSTTQPSQFNRFPSSFSGAAATPRYSSSSFNFSGSESHTIPSSWSNGYLNYGSQPYTKSPLGSLTSLAGRQAQESLYQSYLEKATSQVHAAAPTSQHALTDTIAKAITSDPSFQSALAAAITSYVGGQGTQGGGREGSSHGAKWGEYVGSMAPYAAAGQAAASGCASSYLTRTTPASSNPPQGSMMFLQPPLAFPSSKSASPVEKQGEHQLM